MGDQAMSAFLGCLHEVTRFLQRDPTMRLPFKIEGDKVGAFSVRVQFSQDERWTKALKFMLTDLKWIIAFVESREFNQSNPASVRHKPWRTNETLGRCMFHAQDMFDSLSVCFTIRDRR